MFESLKNVVSKSFDGVKKAAGWSFDSLKDGFSFIDGKLEKAKLYFEKEKQKETIKTSSKLKRLGLDIGLGAATVFNWPIKIAKKAFEGLRKLFGFEGGMKEVDYNNLEAGPVVKKIIKRLNPDQLQSAIVIENVFKEAGLSDKIIAAAIAIAYGESGLRSGAVGDRGNSVGLFQLHSRGAGSGLSVDYRKNPTNNSITILEREVFTKRGNALREADAKGESVAELAAIFSRDIERPRDKYGAMERRRKTAVQLFGDYAA